MKVVCGVIQSGGNTLPSQRIKKIGFIRERTRICFRIDFVVVAALPNYLISIFAFA